MGILRNFEDFVNIGLIGFWKLMIRARIFGDLVFGISGN